MRKHVLLIAALAFVLGSCRHFGGRRIHGNGNMKTEEHTVSAFKDIQVSSSINVYVSQGDFKPIKLEGDENLLQYIEIEQDGEALVIKTKNHFNLESEGDLKVYVTAPNFRKISVSGAGDIIGENKITSSESLDLGMSGAGNIRMELDAPKLSADISGAGSMYLKGQSKDVDITVSGVGSAHCYDLLAENTHVELSGVGSAEVYASVKLEAQASGVGSIHYKGNPPSVDQHVSGVGSISKE